MNDVKTAYQVDYLSVDNWEKDDEGNYVEMVKHYEANGKTKNFETEKEAIQFIKDNEAKLNLCYAKITKYYLTEESAEAMDGITGSWTNWEEDESYETVLLEDLI